MNDLSHLIAIAQKAGEIILQIYHQPSFAITTKSDQSPLTAADLAAHHYITQALQKQYPDIPVLSEESAELFPYALRKNWDTFFLVDPLDGTKEFLQRNGEFTVNIALIKKNEPLLGVVHAPALNVTYSAEKNRGAYKNNVLLSPPIKKDTLTVIVSRSHLCEKTQAFLQQLAAQGEKIQTLSTGSALKFGLVAEGLADVYPRFSPTMEWDTAAGHLLVLEAGKTLRLTEGGGELLYNKAELLNGGFVVGHATTEPRPSGSDHRTVFRDAP